MAVKDIKASVTAILDPPAHIQDGMNITDNAYYNLEAALIDLRRSGADPVCIRTIERVQKQISDVMQLCK